MRSNDKERDRASQAVIDLRTRLGQSQQRFAELTLHSSIMTVSRYEGKFPPRGDALLKLAAIADEHNEIELADVFRGLYVAESFERTGEGLTVLTSSGIGYLRLTLKTPEEMKLAQRFIEKLEVSRGTREANYMHPAEKQINAMMRGLVGGKDAKK